MAVIIREQEVDVDIAEELEEYLEYFPRSNVRGHKLQSCSPFREEKTPSFAVNLENGTWIDSGAEDDSWMKGNFIKLLAYLMRVTYQEAEDYLWEKYKTIYSDLDNWVLTVNLPEEQEYRIVSDQELQPYLFRHSYLTNRGITEKVQKAFRIGYDQSSKAVMLVWHDKDGEPINLKFRSVKDKRFWYLEDGQPIKQHIYGMHFIHKMKITKAYVVESETDALYLWSHGYPAIALGSAHMSKEQERLILNSPLNDLVMAFDRDKAGARCRTDVARRLMGKLDLWNLPIPQDCKDVNDIEAHRLPNVILRESRYLPSFL